MYQGDPTIYTRSSDVHPSAEHQLGIEARSILKSIQTEHAKLSQSGFVARSDLHYFRARYNYYRLSLMRLIPDERCLLEPVLFSFRSKIVEKEAQLESGTPAEESKAPFTPFLSPVEKNDVVQKEEKNPFSELEKKLPDLEDKKPSFQEDLARELLSELSLVRMALTSRVSSEGNQIIADAVDRVICKLNQKNSE